MFKFSICVPGGTVVKCVFIPSAKYIIYTGQEGSFQCCYGTKKLFSK